MKTIDYYMSPGSPWTYLAHARLGEIAKRHSAKIQVRPVDFGVIFPQSGGLPLPKRAPQRQAYRLMELRRWKEHLGFSHSTPPSSSHNLPIEKSGVPRRQAVVGARCARGDVSGGSDDKKGVYGFLVSTLSDCLTLC